MTLPRPNVLFLFSDQHSPRFLGHVGHPVVRTPQLDRLAREGVVFDRAYCQSPLCCPSRASLLTGRYCRDLGIYDNQHILESNGVTFPRVLGAAGYRTCLIGKAHFNGEQFQGYQERPYGDLCGQAHQPDPQRLPERGDAGLGGLIEAAGPSGIPLPLTQTEICVAESAKWLQAHVASRGGQPFCLSVHFDKPHFPICPPPEYFKRYEGRVHLPDLPDGFLEKEVPFVRAAMRNFGICDAERRDRAAHEHALAAYCGCVEWMDDAVGRILATLDYLGLAENTLVVYSSDHGEMAGERGTWQKSVFYEASARVPLLMRLPSITGASGRRIATPVGLIDLFPTFCELAGVATPDTCGGTSLLPLLRSATIDRDAIFSESVVLKEPEHAGCMIRTGRWKYNTYLDGAEELYDLDADPGEWINLAAAPAHRAVLDDLRRRVVAFWQPEKQLARYRACPRMPRQKHFYPYSNQFVLGDGAIVDARP
ncbi:MAG: sulfatase-like hydrolase/transferase [Candidatus Hydrogenedentes bacterium]|nr:sulfatase-like hydrolase/transferase [Candidatus Hydrogenedentota bacterium]